MKKKTNQWVRSAKTKAMHAWRDEKVHDWGPGDEVGAEGTKGRMRFYIVRCAPLRDCGN